MPDEPPSFSEDRPSNPKTDEEHNSNFKISGDDVKLKKISYSTCRLQYVKKEGLRFKLCRVEHIHNPLEKYGITVLWEMFIQLFYIVAKKLNKPQIQYATIPFLTAENSGFVKPI